MSKKQIIITIICCVTCIIMFSAGFCTGRYRRLGILQSNSNGIEQSINRTGDGINQAEDSGNNGIDFGISAITNTNIAIGSLQSANIIALQQGLVYNEVKRLTEEYARDIQSLYSTENGVINNLFEINIRKAEYMERFTESIAKQYGISIESIGE